MPNAKKLPSGKWRIRIEDGKNPDGTRKIKSFTADTRKEVETVAFRWEATRAEREAEEERQRQLEKVPTLDDAMDQYIETCRAQNYSPATLAGYDKIRRNSFPSLIDKKICEITRQEVQLAVDQRAADHSPKTVKNDFSFLCSVLTRYNPDLNLRGIILAKKQKPKKKVMKQVWSSDILREAKKIDEDFYVYTTFIISTGLRPSETYSLTWADLSDKPIDRLDNGTRRQIGTITIDSACVKGQDGKYHEKGPKTDAGYRILEMDWSFFQDLYSVKARGKDDEKLVKMKPNCSKKWSMVKVALGIPNELRFYDLRHYFATSAKQAGASDEELAARMGHNSPVFTHSVYVETFEESIKETSRNLAAKTRELYESLNDEEKPDGSSDDRKAGQIGV